MEDKTDKVGPSNPIINILPPEMQESIIPIKTAELEK